jgi:GMP synthase (glutamine-hydrolysing)
MFRIKQNIYATQFHPEADPEEFVLRINIYKNHGYFPASQAQELINAVKGEHITYPETVLQNFISKYKR